MGFGPLRWFVLTAALLCAGLPAHARIGLVVGEPFGSFGTMMPQGHANIYLDHICPDTPTHVRPCAPGETGAVISRFHDLRHPSFDWLAMPAIPFFYGVDDPAETPSFVTPELVTEIRERYREQHLRSTVPDRIDRHGESHPPPYGDWDESIGATFDRRLFLYIIDTTPAQDAAILAFLNDRPNKRRYGLGRANCADFAADLLAIALPPATIHRNVLADFDMTTPKQLARLMDAYGRAHPELHFQVYEVPQLPGTTRRSRPIRGAAESLITTKRYFFTVLVLQPELMLTNWIIYEKKGKWKPGLDALTLSPQDWLRDVAGVTPSSGAAAAADAASSNSP